MPPLRILVTGATGFLGPYAQGALAARGYEVVTTARSGGDAMVDLTQPGMVAAVLEALSPAFVLNLAAMARLGDCEQDPERAHRTNVQLPGLLAERCGDRLLHVSTDLVFDGRSAPYDERSATAPLSVYGGSKVEGEEAVVRLGGRVVRLPLLFGADARGRGASSSVRKALREQRPVELYTNEYRTPLHALDAAQGLAELIALRRCPQILHLPGPERCSRWELARRLCAVHQLDAMSLVPVECQDGLRPRDVSLCGTWQARRSLDDMLQDA